MMIAPQDKPRFTLKELADQYGDPELMKHYNYLVKTFEVIERFTNDRMIEVPLRNAKRDMLGIIDE